VFKEDSLYVRYFLGIWDTMINKTDTVPALVNLPLKPALWGVTMGKCGVLDGRIGLGELEQIPHKKEGHMQRPRFSMGVLPGYCHMCTCCGHFGGHTLFLSAALTSPDCF
jgi:hypothetical protein